MADETFHQTQHDLARTLIRTFYEALAVQFERKDHITRDELDRAADELLDVFVNGTLIGRGEVVTVGDKFGVRMTELVAPEKRG